MEKNHPFPSEQTIRVITILSEIHDLVCKRLSREDRYHGERAMGIEEGDVFQCHPPKSCRHVGSVSS